MFAIENGPVEIVYPLKMVIFHGFLYVYQRVNDPFPINWLMLKRGHPQINC
jgi:hypothetical protein